MVNYGISWTNAFGKRVIYPEKTWKRKGNARKFAVKLKLERARHGVFMKNVRVMRL